MIKNKKMIAFIFSEALMKLVTFAALPFITVKLSVADFGLYAIFIVNFVVISALFVSILNNYILVCFFTEGLKRVLLKIKSACLYCLLFTLLGMGVALVFILFDVGANYSLAFIIALIACLVSLPWQIYLALMQCQKKFLCYARVVFVYLAIYCTLFAFTLINDELTWIDFSLLYIAGNLLTSIFILIKERSIVAKIYKAKMFGFSLYANHFMTLLPNSVFSWARVNCDKYFVAFFLGNTLLGVYSLGFQIGSAIGLVNAVVLKVINPYLFSSFSGAVDKNIVRNVSLIMLFMCFIVMVYILATPFIVDTFFSDDYQNSIDIAQIIALGYLLQCLTSIFSAVLFYEKRNKLISALSFISFLAVTITFTKLQLNGGYDLKDISIIFTLVWAGHFVFVLYYAMQSKALKRVLSGH